MCGVPAPTCTHILVYLYPCTSGLAVNTPPPPHNARPSHTHVLALGGVERKGDAHGLHHLHFIRSHVCVQVHALTPLLVTLPASAALPAIPAALPAARSLQANTAATTTVTSWVRGKFKDGGPAETGS